MDCRGDDEALTDRAGDRNRSAVGGRDHSGVGILEPAVALEGGGIVPAEERLEESRLDRLHPTGAVPVAVDEPKREPVVGVGPVDRSPEDDKGAAALEVPPDPARRGAERDKGPRVGGVRKTRRDDQDAERPPEERGRAELGVTRSQLAPQSST